MQRGRWIVGVALLAEGVDRNTLVTPRSLLGLVALLAEGVDRNIFLWFSPCTASESPSSRRAWIEILMVSAKRLLKNVALLAEGVDRNQKPLDKTEKVWVALLAEGVDRNLRMACSPRFAKVALLAEGVDRNFFVIQQKQLNSSRPPRGGRG